MFFKVNSDILMRYVYVVLNIMDKYNQNIPVRMRWIVHGFVINKNNH